MVDGWLGWWATCSNLEHSTILYESPDNSPLVRVAWNKLDPNLLATFAMDSSRLTVLDVRVSVDSRRGDREIGRGLGRVG